MGTLVEIVAGVVLGLIFCCSAGGADWPRIRYQSWPAIKQQAVPEKLPAKKVVVSPSAQPQMGGCANGQCGSGFSFRRR